VNWNFTHFSTNSRGIRYLQEIGPKRPEGLRIVCVGDSVTFGFRVPMARPESPESFDPLHVPFETHIERRLRECNPGKPIECIPLGVPGYTSHQGLIWLRRELNRLDPDVVTLCFGFNDTQLRQQDSPTRLPDDKTTIPTDWLNVMVRRVMMRSQAMIYFVRWRAARSAPPKTPGIPPKLVSIPRVSMEDYVSNFRQMVRLIHEHGAKAIVIAPVYRDRVTYDEQTPRILGYARALGKAMTEDKVPYLDLREVNVEGYPFNMHLFGEIIHPGEMGHRLMANRIMDFMAAQKMLGEFRTEP